MNHPTKSLLSSVPALLLALPLAGSLVACGGSQPAAEADPHDGHAGHEGHAGHAGHAGHEGHGGHDHSSPEALEPLMRDLYARMVEIRAALVEDDAETIAAPAHAVAVACDDQNVHEFDPEQFGPRFGEIDELLHSASAELSEAATAGDLDQSRELYGTLLTHCGDCHAQAPTAQEVDLTALALP